jgi:cephalosporin hydroxylase
VLRELNLYHQLVTPGSYLIVEDTHFNGRPILPKHGPGPWEAVDEFLVAHPEFQPDRSREKYGMSFNPRGYLKRLR